MCGRAPCSTYRSGIVSTSLSLGLDGGFAPAGIVRGRVHSTHRESCIDGLSATAVALALEVQQAHLWRRVARFVAAAILWTIVQPALRWSFLAVLSATAVVRRKPSKSAIRVAGLCAVDFVRRPVRVTFNRPVGIAGVV